MVLNRLVKGLAIAAIATLWGVWAPVHSAYAQVDTGPGGFHEGEATDGGQHQHEGDDSAEGQ